jgi:hypothetical protein
LLVKGSSLSSTFCILGSIVLHDPCCSPLEAVEVVVASSSSSRSASQREALSFRRLPAHVLCSATDSNGPFDTPQKYREITGGRLSRCKTIIFLIINQPSRLPPQAPQAPQAIFRCSVQASQPTFWFSEACARCSFSLLPYTRLSARRFLHLNDRCLLSDSLSVRKVSRTAFRAELGAPKLTATFRH